MTDRITFEVCIDSVEGALAATRGGGDRLELCSALSEGGITPSYGLVRRVLDVTSLPVMMMIRCRAGNFVYSDAELEVMQRDIEVAKQLGVYGVVFGVLTEDHKVDREINQQLIDAARPMHVTFHRAFDEPSVRADAAMSTLQQLGVDRLLTSGQQDSAEKGVLRIQEMVTQNEKLIVMPGAGVRPENAAEIIRVSGAREIHGTASGYCEARKHRVTSEETVRQIREALDALS